MVVYSIITAQHQLLVSTLCVSDVAEYEIQGKLGRIS
jgi:hypothetical protein